MARDMVRNVFEWDYFYIYLSGPVDFVSDGGSEWRDAWADKIADELGVKRKHILNPRRKSLRNAPFDFGNEKEIIRKYREKQDYESIVKMVSQIAHVDLRLVDKSDIVLVNLPQVGRSIFEPYQKEIERLVLLLREYEGCQNETRNTGVHINKLVSKVVEIASSWRVPTYGTLHEMVVARQQRKPVYLVWEGGKENCSGWLMWLLGGPEYVFSEVDDMVAHLKSISLGKESYDATEWLFLDM